MFNTLFIVELINSGPNTRIQKEDFSFEMQSNSVYLLKNNDFSLLL